jgi:hypothetical protein
MLSGMWESKDLVTRNLVWRWFALQRRKGALTASSQLQAMYAQSMLQVLAVNFEAGMKWA